MYLCFPGDELFLKKTFSGHCAITEQGKRSAESSTRAAVVSLTPPRRGRPGPRAGPGPALSPGPALGPAPRGDTRDPAQPDACLPSPSALCPAQRRGGF